MKARDVEKALNRYTGRIVINLSQLAKAFGKSRSWAKEFTEELEPVENGRCRSYLIRDVAELLEQKGI